MKRRSFLQSLALNTSLFYLGNQWAYPIFSKASTGSKDHFFVLIQIQNGWDVTLSLDPKVYHSGLSEEDVFIEYRPEDIFQYNKLKMGPALSPLYDYAQDIHIIRGIEMRRDAGHETNREIISSGYGDGKTAILPVELGATYGQGPLGVIVDRGQPVGQRKVLMTDINAVSGASGSGDILQLLDGDSEVSFGAATEALINSTSYYKKIQEYVQGYQDSPPNNNFVLPLLAAFKAEASYQAVISLTADLDTHSDHEGRHLENQKEAWSTVAELFQYFKNSEYKQGSLFDYTTFMVVSEFSRTPALNSSGGKDHNPHANAVLLAGKGVQGGSVTGESFVIKKADSRSGIGEHRSRPIDYRTGEVITQASDLTNQSNLIFPENVSATLGDIFGVARNFYREKESSSFLPGVKKA